MNCVLNAASWLAQIPPSEMMKHVPHLPNRRGWLVPEFFPYFLRKGKVPIHCCPVYSSPDYPFVCFNDPLFEGLAWKYPAIIGYQKDNGRHHCGAYRPDAGFYSGANSVIEVWFFLTPKELEEMLHAY